MDFDQRINRPGAVVERRSDGVTDFVTEDGAIYRVQDVTEIVERNRILRDNDRFKGFRLAPKYRRVASIPVAAVDIAFARGLDIMNDPDAMKRFLNDPENRAFRTTTERV